MCGQTDDFTTLSPYMFALATKEHADRVPRTKHTGIADDVMLVDDNPQNIRKLTVGEKSIARLRRRVHVQNRGTRKLKTR